MNYTDTKEWHEAYNYMVTTLYFATMAVKQGSCNNPAIKMHNATCARAVRDWYGIATR